MIQIMGNFFKKLRKFQQNFRKFQKNIRKLTKKRLKTTVFYSHETKQIAGVCP